MISLKRLSRIGILPILLWTSSCVEDSGTGIPPAGTGNPPVVMSGATGYFRITLTEKTEISQGLPTVQGRVYDGPMPSSLAWLETARSGACALYEPRAPFCSPSCGSGALCVSDGVCKAYPKSVGVGKVTVSGAKTTAGAASFAMDPVLNAYQPPAGVNLEYVPFAEGDPVTVSAAGDAGQAAFSLSAKAIARLAVLNDSIVMADGQPIPLRWTPPAKDVGSTISVAVDISHHGGTRGKIECETADNGALDIDASLLDALKALGVSGWPQMEITRKTAGASDLISVDLEIESPITKLLSIPGLISCSGDGDCPEGKTCQLDLQCK